MKGKRFVTYIITILVLLSFFQVENNVNISAEDGAGKLVYVIPVENEVERGLEAFMKRSIQEATEAGADHIILEINTPGGAVNAAGNIATMLQDLTIPTSSYIIQQAASAGSYIALNTDTIYMNPHSGMGASGIINSDGTAADKKAQSFWLKQMESAAESKGRDPLYALAMADDSIDLPEYGAPEGDFLTLSPQEAVEVKYSEGIVSHRTELLHELGLSNAEIVEMETTPAESVARFLTSPVVVPILLSLASLGLVVELYSPGFGVPGTMGLVSLLLFFYGHFIAGLAGMEAILLLILGIALIIAEFFVPGGIMGLIGIGAIIGSLLMAGADLSHMTMSIAIAFLVAIFASVILFRRIGMDKGVFRHVILKDQTTTELGYVSKENRLDLIGLEGVTVTPLRPAGTAIFDNERIDVVSEGAFIGENKRIKVVKVEGVRIVVREL
ncbi:membrane-bound serine protease (ClpP class) [Oceanobacillus limi]|uniref:Membrane-bound serine protease (ClpP class) n=1 Tax=Oceanobacillus limi TaxID=930131 RepID=A0A1I0FTA9_9BACI|nr:nodulation protein NfeD [Oceanobacillus limi]SET61466.1 membrane-bound serine protease (ClpP class) [Oceanobacillus limi]